MPGPYLVLTKTLQGFFDPFRDDTWNTGKLLRSDVEKAIAQGALDARQNTHALRATMPYPHRSPDQYLYDIRRVAFLVVHRSPWPIELDVLRGRIMVKDGAHRLAAAIYRKDPHIPLNCSGDIAEFDRRFRHKLLLAEWPDAAD